MKALIWIVCFLCNAMVQVIIKNQGIILGGIPMALLFGVTWIIAQRLCKALDKHRDAKKHDDPQSKSDKKPKVRLFLFLHRKFFTTLLIVSCILSIVCFIGYFVCDSNMNDAIYHYDVAFERQDTIGCGEWHCKYCEGKETPAWYMSDYGSPYQFRYYSAVSDRRTIFEGVCVISLIFAGILLIVFFINKKFSRKMKSKL